jgi:Alkali metal cation/H+ antiporter Nha1 C terminus
MSIVSRVGLTKGKKGKIGPISEPRDGRPFNSDPLREGGPISMSAIGRQDINVHTAPEAARRREERRYDIGDVRMEGHKENGDISEETLVEKINSGHETWREGDNIIIEDEEGEVIHTITSSREHEVQMAAERFGKAELDKVGSTVDKANQEVEGITGRLKKIWSGRKDSDRDERRKADLEQGIPHDPENTEIFEKRHTSAESSKASPKHSPGKTTSGPVFMVDEDNRRTTHVSDTTERRAREERDKETEVERRRREAVFGSIRNDSEDEDDAPIPPISRSKGKQPETSSSSSDEESSEGSLNQNSSGRAESSASGSAQLLSAPPFRAREIRFGDINVGEESFSLEEGPPSTGARHHKTGSGDWRVRRNK